MADLTPWARVEGPRNDPGELRKAADAWATEGQWVYAVYLAGWVRYLEGAEERPPLPL